MLYLSDLGELCEFGILCGGILELGFEIEDEQWKKFTQQAQWGFPERDPSTIDRQPKGGVMTEDHPSDAGNDVRAAWETNAVWWDAYY